LGGGHIFIVWTFFHLGPNVCSLMQNNEIWYVLYVSTVNIAPCSQEELTEVV